MDELADRIAAAFQTGAPPPKRVVVHRCDECERVSFDFAGRKWSELSTDVLEYHHDSIPLLSPEAFAYYLPAYLIFAAKEPDRIGEMVLYGIGPSSGERTAERRAACQYSDEQRRLIVEVAEMIAGDDNEHFGRFLRRAREYWA
ncbi:MAG TPA: DUF6714 family protein [Polyangia bacterium]|nr:DUF6714 family protein [Polyangia bacterium]